MAYIYIYRYIYGVYIYNITIYIRHILYIYIYIYILYGPPPVVCVWVRLGYLKIKMGWFARLTHSNMELQMQVRRGSYRLNGVLMSHVTSVMTGVHDCKRNGSEAYL